MENVETKDAMRDIIIDRIITLCKKANMVGFEDSVAVLTRKMQNITDKDLVLMFENVVTICFKQNIS